MAEQQTQGRGRHGRGWETQPDALLASWLVANDGDVHHRPMDQLRVGEGVVRLLQTLAGGAREGVLLKWPNDIWIRSKHGRFAKAGGVLFEAVSQGKNTKLVLGLGLNTKVNHEHTWSGTLDLNISLSTREIHTAVHALVSSLFEVVTGLGPTVDWHTRIEAAVLNGSKAFKELFYRGERVSVSGVDPSGKLVLSGRTEGIDDPEDLTWSIR